MGILIIIVVVLCILVICLLLHDHSLEKNQIEIAKGLSQAFQHITQLSENNQELHKSFVELQAQVSDFAKGVIMFMEQFKSDSKLSRTPSTSLSKADKEKLN